MKPEKLYHATTEKKAKLYRHTGATNETCQSNKDIWAHPCRYRNGGTRVVLQISQAQVYEHREDGGKYATHRVGTGVEYPAA